MLKISSKYYFGFIIVVLVFLQACGRPVKPEEPCNFVQNAVKQRISWNEDMPIEMMVHKSVPKEYVGAIRETMDAWNKLMGKELLKVSIVGVGGSPLPEKDNFSIIYMLDEWDANKPREQARTSVYWRGSQIIESDIRINNVNFEFSVNNDGEAGKVDLHSLLIHEFGHVLGLGHIEEQASVMHAELAKGQVRRELPLGGPDYLSLICEY